MHMLIGASLDVNVLVSRASTEGWGTGRSGMSPLSGAPKTNRLHNTRRCVLRLQPTCVGHGHGVYLRDVAPATGGHCSLFVYRLPSFDAPYPKGHLLAFGCMPDGYHTRAHDWCWDYRVVQAH